MDICCFQQHLVFSSLLAHDHSNFLGKACWVLARVRIWFFMMSSCYESISKLHAEGRVRRGIDVLLGQLRGAVYWPMPPILCCGDWFAATISVVYREIGQSCCLYVGLWKGSTKGAKGCPRLAVKGCDELNHRQQSRGINVWRRTGATGLVCSRSF